MPNRRNHDEALQLLRTLGTRVKLVRIASGLSKEELSVRSGVSRRMIAYVETAETNPSITVVMRLAAALECDVAELVDPFPLSAQGARSASAQACSATVRDVDHTPAVLGARC